MRVLQILPKMNIGGVEKGVLDFSSYFKSDMVVVSGGGRWVKKLEEAGAKHYTLSVYRKSPVSIFSIGKLRRIIKEEKVDIVHARSRVPAWIAFFATRGLDVPFMTTAHGAYSVHNFSEVMGWGKFVICPSKSIIRHMMDNFGVRENKVRLVPRWVDLDKFTFKPQTDRRLCNSILSIGRISPSKGYEYLIEAFRKIARHNPYLTLTIVGEAEPSKTKYFQYLKSLVTRYALNYQVRFLGYREDVNELLDTAFALVIPSVVEEAFGRVVVEAFAAGVPVVATRMGALEEIIEHRQDGILVFPRNADSLAEGLLEIVNNPPLAQKLIENARRKVETLYSFSHCVREVEKVYREVVRHKRILVMKISSLGDVILSIPSLKAIKEQCPDSELVLLTLKKYSSLFYGCPYVDRVIGLDADYKRLRNIVQLSRSLRRESFDYVIDLQNNRASHLIAFLTLPQKSFGYSRKWGRLLTHKVPVSKKSVSPLESQEKILNAAGIVLTDKRLRLWDMNVSQPQKWEFSDEACIGINMSASVKWQTKNWPLAHTKKLIELILREFPKMKVVLLGDEHSVAESKLLEKIAPHSVINLCGKTTLGELVGVLAHVKIFITQDTAPLHLACALGIKVIALFGPTDPDRHTVKSDYLHLVVRKIPCSFCYKPVCKDNVCMTKITPQEIMMRIQSILGKSG
ncbi:MAG: glycosyltransferase [Candidatus Omnitrophica bacterium]|nr:glycosyltransferase [Candidatus Omnitrophota bacterium]